ncbi:unnamed protein product, partial [Polarella glacialis]
QRTAWKATQGDRELSLWGYSWGTGQNCHRPGRQGQDLVPDRPIEEIHRTGGDGYRARDSPRGGSARSVAWARRNAAE